MRGIIVLIVITLKQIWKRIRLGFDRSISGSWFKQILWLISIILVCGGIFLVTNRLYTGQARFDEWDVVGLFLGTDSDAVARNGNIYFGYAIIIVGAIIINGLLISFFANIMQGRVDDFRKGYVKYSFSDHIVVLGYNDMVVDVVKQLVGFYPKKDIVVQTTLNAEDVRARLFTRLDRKEERNVVVINNQRDSMEALEDLVVDRAVKVYIIGEDGDVDHDAISVNCLKKIATICRDRKRQTKLPCVTYLQNQSTFVLFQTADISDEIKDRVDFIPFNFDEVWSRKVLVTCRSEMNGISYMPLDRSGIDADSDKFVHLVVIGMTPMGAMLAIEAAHVAHYPNFVTKGIKTKITLVDIEARREMDYMTSCFNHFFDQCDYSYKEIDKAKLVYEEQVKSINPNGSFVDIEFEFIKANVADDMIRHMLTQWADDDNRLLTIAICLKRSTQNIATALYLPDKVYEKDVAIVVKQNTSGELLNLVGKGSSAASGDAFMKYRNIRPFGMHNDGYDVEETIYRWAKRINYLYTYYYDNDKIPTSYPDETVDRLWDGLSVSDKWSSMYNALSIPATLRSVGIDYQDKNHRKEFTDSELELLSIVEHNRWNADRLLAGYRPSNEAESARIMDDIENKKGQRLKKHYKGRMIHYDIRPYDDLRDDDTGKNVKRFDKGVTEGIFGIIED